MRPAPMSVEYRPGRRLWLWPGVGAPLVAVHGFTGDGLDFEALADNLPSPLIAPDLVGHGRSDAPSDPGEYTFDRQTDDLVAVGRFVRTQLGQPIWFGYSMGARLSLAAAPRLSVAMLVLAGVHPGFQREPERNERRAHDGALAERIEALGVQAFLEEWQSLPLMRTQASQPDPYRSRRRERRGQNQAHALAATLRGAGTHAMPDLRPIGAALRCPVRLVSGETDEKFRAIAEDLVAQWPGVEHRVLPGGHATHLEAPEALADAISSVTP